MALVCVIFENYLWGSWMVNTVPLALLARHPYLAAMGFDNVVTKVLAQAPFLA